jgi:hypothetical protein
MGQFRHENSSFKLIKHMLTVRDLPKPAATGRKPVDFTDLPPPVVGKSIDGDLCRSSMNPLDAGNGRGRVSGE